MQILLFYAGFFGISQKNSKYYTEKLLDQMISFDKRNHQVGFLFGSITRYLIVSRRLTHHPKLLILDEPTAGMDVELRKSLWGLI